MCGINWLFNPYKQRSGWSCNTRMWVAGIGSPLTISLYYFCGGWGYFLSYLTRRVERRSSWYFYMQRCSFNFPLIVCRRLFSLFQSGEATCTSNEKYYHRVWGSYGQAINLPKSEIYCSRNFRDKLENSITNIMGVQYVLDTRKYLGLPSLIVRD